MGYKNPYALGNACCGDGCYSINSHGCPSATYESITNANLPSYAHGFYSPTQHESLQEVRYSRTEIGYDSSLREIKRAIEGAPLEAYAPGSHRVEDSGSAVPKTGASADIEPIVIKNPNKEIVEEILKAQQAVAGRELLLREIEVEEIIIKRRMRKREIRLRNNED